MSAVIDIAVRVVGRSEFRGAGDGDPAPLMHLLELLSLKEIAFWSSPHVTREAFRLHFVVPVDFEAQIGQRLVLTLRPEDYLVGAPALAA